MINHQNGLVGSSLLHQRGIPVFVLGRTFYEDYPGVRKIESMNQLSAELSRFEATADRHPTEQPMNLYLRTCFPGSFDYMQDGMLTTDNVEHLLEPIRIVLRDSRA